MAREDQRLQHHEEARNEPGFIQDFTGVSQYVRFGTNAEGEYYCFDFDGDPREPSVVYWDQYWRRVAPNFETFGADRWPMTDEQKRRLDEVREILDETDPA